MRKKAFTYHVLHDAAFQHSAAGFRALRSPAKPPFVAVSTDVAQPAAHLQPLSRGEWMVTVPRPSVFRPGEPVSFGSAQGLVVNSGAEGVHVAFGEDTPPAKGILHQTHHDCTPAELHAGFAAFWQPWWQRDSSEESQSLAHWPSFCRFLQQYPCPWGEVGLDFENLDAWNFARKTMRTKSSTGACGFSVAEIKALPDQAVQHVARLFRAALPYRLPSCLLTGRVNVLAKTHDPRGYTDGRPICVLPVLYRWWTSVCCRQLLNAWSDKMPKGVCGGLPGRSARDITYRLQHELEVAVLAAEPISGFVLDIIKCFNALPRMPMQALLIHVGCPPLLAKSWIAGLHCMGRASSFVGDVSALQFSSTGVPEGDGMSVAAAVSLGWLFASLVADFGLTPHVFIDNWAWTSADEALHAAGLEQTLQLVRSLKIEVDWHKTFGWSTHSAGRQWWREHAKMLLPDACSLAVLHEAKDLGAAMRYHSSRTLGCLKARLFEGQQRLERLAQQPRSLSNKALLIGSSVWPATFFACEGHAIGRQRIAALRGKAARALIGPHHHVAPLIALSTLTGRCLDPEVYILTACLRALRRAFRVDPELAQSVLRTAVAASGLPQTVIGPGTALKAVLCRNHWTLHESGLFTAPGNLRFNIRSASSNAIEQTVAKAWMYHVRQSVLHRRGLAQMGVPDPYLTASLLRSFPPADQKTLARHITGAFQTQATKHLWGGAPTNVCPWCGGVETRWHRFMECDAFCSLRLRHSDAVGILLQRPEWVYMPCATLPEVDDVLTLLFQTRQPPLQPPAVSQFDQVPLQQPVWFFTDGTCHNPTIPYARHAAWALVCDFAFSPALREQALAFWHSSRCLPPAFRVLDLGVVPGAQSIPRAELCAALQAVRVGFHHGQRRIHVVTDSNSVIHVLTAFQAGSTSDLFVSAANQDLLQLLREVWYPGVSFQKVKSDLDPELLEAPDQLWAALGNKAADEACVSAIAADMDIVKEMVLEAASCHRSQKDQLTLVYRYLLELNRATQVKRNSPSQGQGPASSPQLDTDTFFDLERPAIQQWLRFRTQDEAVQGLPVPPWHIFATSKWGAAFTWRLWRWSQTLQWFALGDSPDRGTTTLELLCNFIVVTSSLPPVAVSGAEGGVQYLDFEEPEARMTPVPLRTWILFLTMAINTLAKATGAVLFPSTGSRKVASLQAWGDVHPRSGFLSTCRMTRPEESASLILRVLRAPGTQTLRTFVQQHASATLRLPHAFAAAGDTQ